METIKSCLITILKESLKFALFGIVSFLLLGSLSAYMILYVFHTDVEISSAVAGVIIAIIVAVVGWKKFHISDKIVDNNRKILNILKNRYFKNDE